MITVTQAMASPKGRLGLFLRRQVACQRAIPTTRSCRFLSSTDIPSPVTRQDLLAEAESLSKSLYRTCLRSVQDIRWGNEMDELDFKRREEEFANPSSGGGILSMAPPPDREDELKSRAEYYHSYTREHFTQESDCLDNDPLRERDIKRYLYYLRKGDKDRKWLLGDMMFQDKHKDAMDIDRVERFEAMAKRYLGEDDEMEENATTNNIEKDDFFGAEDDSPEWFQRKFPNLK